MDCADIVKSLLAKGCRPDTYALMYHPHAKYSSAIVAALESRNMECAKVLIENSDVNRMMYKRFQPRWELGSTTNFSHFVETFLDHDEL